MKRWKNLHEPEGRKIIENAPGIVSRLPSPGFLLLYYWARPQSCIILIWRAVGVDFGKSAYLFLISQPHLKNSNSARRLPFHVDAVDRQTSGSKMLIILTWACGKALLSDLKFQLMNWWTRVSQGERDLYRIKSPRPRRSHSSSLTPIHVCMWLSFYFAYHGASGVGFLQKLVATCLFSGKHSSQILKSQLHLVEFALVVLF